MKKKIVSVLMAMLTAAALLSFAACSKESSAEPAAPGTADTSGGESGENIMIQIEMENGGIIQLELYPGKAPITVENFVSLVNEKFYDGLIFHRVIKDFMIQGGDPEGTGFGGSGKTIKGEFTANGVENDLSHERGVISMARSKQMDSASSQFFICHQDAKFLDGQYAAFGRVIEGMDVVDEIASVETDKRNDRPLEDVVIKSIRVIEG